MKNEPDTNKGGPKNSMSSREYAEMGRMSLTDLDTYLRRKSRREYLTRLLVDLLVFGCLGMLLGRIAFWFLQAGGYVPTK